MNETDTDFLKVTSKEIKQMQLRTVPGSGALSDKIIEVIRKQKGLTYVAAYAGLQKVYETLRAESNFVQIQPDRTLVDLVKHHLEQDHREI